MGKIIFVLRKVICIAIMICVCSYLYSITPVHGLESDDNLTFRNEISPAPVKQISENTGYTNINGISNMIINLTEKGYHLDKDYGVNNTVDRIYKANGKQAIRIYYIDSTGYYALFSSKFENSGILSTYLYD